VYIDLSVAATMIGVLGSVMYFIWWLLLHVIINPLKKMIEGLQQAVERLADLLKESQDDRRDINARLARLEEKEAAAAAAMARAHRRIDELAAPAKRGDRL
jgi:septal ring factor EnvC (AmiA/AmiB activator)